MTLLGDVSSVVGKQVPRVASVPTYTSSAGPEAIDLAASVGLHLDPWQQYVLTNALGERPDGKWSASSVGLLVPRQNGKGSILEARELAGLFLFGERLIVHTAHLFETAQEHMLRLQTLIEDTPWMDAKVAKILTGNGKESITLKTGQRIKFKTRTKGGGRGLSGDLVVLDEAYELSDAQMDALMPTMAARPNHQIWYTSSAVNRRIHDNGHVLARLRRRGHEGTSARLAFMEWCTVVHTEPCWDQDRVLVCRDPEHRMPDDREAWAESNPGYLIRIHEETVVDEFESLTVSGFAAERLGIGDWPSDTVDQWAVLAQPKWTGCEEPTSRPEGVLAFALDISPDRTAASIGVAGRNSDGVVHGELQWPRGEGTRWVLNKLIDMVAEHSPWAVVLDPAGPAGSLIPKLQAALKDTDTELHLIGAREYAQACGALFDAVENGEFAHLGQEPLTAAAAGAAKRPLGDAWAWDRKTPDVDITPLVAVTLAVHGIALYTGPVQEASEPWVLYD